MTTAREEILRRVRTALAGAPDPHPAQSPAAADSPDAPAIPRDYLDAHGTLTPQQLTDLLAENLADYRAHVHRANPAQLPALVVELLRKHGSTTVLTPDGLPAQWLGALDGSGVRAVVPTSAQTPADLDAVDSVLTTCTLAVAETGSIVLNAGTGQGQRRHTLVPDHHICVVRTPAQVVASVPQALPRLDPGSPTTWISGPSATSDIELDRVEGVHGPRTLDVVLLADGSEAAGAE